MSKENVQGFYDSVKKNEELNKALLEAVSAGNVVVLAKEKGFEFTQVEHDEFMAVIAEDMSKLSDDQLEEVAGGYGIPNPQFKVSCKQCSWTSGWQNVLAGKVVAAYTGLHTASSGGHKDYEIENRT